MKTGLYFSCQIGNLPADMFSVVEFTLDEGLSELYTLTLTLVSQECEIALNEQLLRTASLTVLVNGQEQRKVVGVIASLEQGDVGFRHSFYTVTIRPHLWRLTLKQDSRIFHFQTVAQIIDLILREHHIVSANHLVDKHQTREYVTQKRETDYDFLCRIAAEEGISFWFEEEKNWPILFYSDSRFGQKAGLNLIYNPHIQSPVNGDLVHKLRFGAFMCPEKVIYKDHTYTHPNYRFMHTAPVGGASGGDNRFTVFDSFGRFDGDADGKPFTKYRLEALRADSESGIAESNCIKLMPGRIFRIAEHPVDRINRSWQVVSVQHQGKMPQGVEEDNDGSPATLSNSVKFIPSNVNWRPAFCYKPLADGDEVATVVGPSTEEVYTNADGCVRIHFHWNRYDVNDDQASCWVRVTQGWSGNGYGFMAVPRIGQEVIVSYLNGDIDRPIVSGCTYNAVNRPPLDLPLQKTRTTFKTQSHKGKGFNELYFEDSAGSEEIGLHAQKDMKIYVKNDRIEHVVNDRHLDVDNQRFSHIKSHDHLTIDGELRVNVKGNSSNLVEGDVYQKYQGQYLTEVGNEIYQRAGTKLILEAGAEITLKVAGSFIKIDPSGISLEGPAIKINSGTTPGVGSAVAGLFPNFPDRLQPRPMQIQRIIAPIPAQLEMPEVIKTVHVKLSPLPTADGYPNESYKLYRDGQFLQQGKSDEKGYITLKHMPEAGSYAVELLNGARFNVDILENFDRGRAGKLQRMGSQGFFDHHRSNNTDTLRRWQAFNQQPVSGDEKEIDDAEI